MTNLIKAVSRYITAAIANTAVRLFKAMGSQRLEALFNKPHRIQCLQHLIRLVLGKKIRFQENNLKKILAINEAEIATLNLKINQNTVTTFIESAVMDGKHFNRTEWRGLEHLEQRNNRGVLFVGAHINNWEICRRNLDYKGFECAYLYRDFSNAWFNHRLINRAARQGELGIPTDQTPLFIEHLKQGGSGYMLLDLKDKGRNGTKVPLCQRNAWTSTFPAQMAKEHELLLVPVILHRNGAGFIQEVFPPADTAQSIDNITLYLNDILGQQITNRPESWLLWDTNRWGL